MSAETVCTSELPWPADPEEASWENFAQLSRQFDDTQWWLVEEAAKGAQVEPPVGYRCFYNKLCSLSHETLAVLGSTSPSYHENSPSQEYPDEFLALISSDTTLELVDGEREIFRMASRTHPAERLSAAYECYQAALGISSIMSPGCEGRLENHPDLLRIRNEFMREATIYGFLAQLPEENQNGV